MPPTTGRAISQQDPEYQASLSEEVIAIVTVFQVFSSVALGLRLWTRLQIQRLRLSADDWVILVAWATDLALGTIIGFQTRYGLGKHVADLPPDIDFITSNILFYAHQPIYYISVSLTKVSIIVFYFRLFPQQSYRAFLWAIMVVVLLTGIATSVAGVFQCDPIARSWNADIPGTCFNQPALFFANGGLNIAEDLILYFLPIGILWNMNLPLRQRVALIGIFVIGGLTIIAGIVRIPSLKQAIVSTDPTWDHVGSSIWSSIECNIGIICACLVHLKPLIAHIAPAALGPSRPSRGARMMRLSDKHSDDAAAAAAHHSPLQTFGQRRGSKPVGVLTEIDREEESSASGQPGLVPAWCRGNPDVTVSTPGQPEPRAGAQMEQPNAIYATRQYAVSYGR
ncbi:putative integral membrane protein [Rosellinia necatrix]|uniref:Putative integral membrane protein n=1 Tax=Rosellinia necatrix TaxID=77044 RepID=A0A1W2TQE0_ROSNE|nr:putative integral membrane protein [Rosellinia necatrix]